MSSSPSPPDRAVPGRLYLVPAPLDFGCEPQADLQDSLPLGTIQVAARLTHWICENAKTTRAYLKRVGQQVPLLLPLQSLVLQELPRDGYKKGEATGQFDARALLAPALIGQDMGLVSEAGMPAVADPGAAVVRAAHDLGLVVVPLVGPVSLLLALAASGLNGQEFSFVGYLPQDPNERTQRIGEIESLALKTGQTQIFIETPYRNAAMLQALLKTLQHNTRLSVCSGLTLASAQCRSHTVKHWRTQNPVLDKNIPAVFALGR